MKKTLFFIFIIILFNCNTPTVDDSTDKLNNNTKFDLEFKNGTNIPFGGSSSQKAYAIWLENENKNFIQNIFICQNIIDLSTRKMTPYWTENKKAISDSDEIDSVTAATHNISGNKNIDFTISNITLKNKNIRTFKVYFEIARSWDGNDWFVYSPEDQPAILYCAEIDLDTPQTEYILNPIGWTPNNTNEETTGISISGWALYTLNTEIKYITHLRTAASNTFGAEDTVNSATKMVKEIKLIIK